MYKRGFTLIEILVVIAIIAILTGIILPSLSGSKASARDAKRISDIKNIQLALALYYNDNGRYPHTTSLTSLLEPIYMSKVPVDPLTNQPYKYVALMSTSLSALNCAATGINIASYYHLGAVLEASTGGHNADRSVDPSNGNETIGTGTYKACNSVANFHGTSNGCNGYLPGSGLTNNFCYDVEPNL